eukprot:2017915-Pyramimonas_sp.AAC.1
MQAHVEQDVRLEIPLVDGQVCVPFTSTPFIHATMVCISAEMMSLTRFDRLQPSHLWSTHPC